MSAADDMPPRKSGRDDRPAPESGRARSDLIGLELTAVLGVAVLVITASFYLIGPVAGMVLLLAGSALAIVGVVVEIRRAEEPPD